MGGGQKVKELFSPLTSRGVESTEEGGGGRGDLTFDRNAGNFLI